MPSTYILDENIVEYLQEINETIKNRKNWSSYEYDATLESLKLALKMINNSYRKLTGTTLEDTARRLFEGTQMGGIDIFISYYNGFLFVRKLEYKLQWHRDYGSSVD